MTPWPKQVLRVKAFGERGQRRICLDGEDYVVGGEPDRDLCGGAGRCTSTNLPLPGIILDNLHGVPELITDGIFLRT